MTGDQQRFAQISIPQFLLRGGTCLITQLRHRRRAQGDGGLNQLAQVLAQENLLALALDRVHGWLGASLDETGGPILEVLLHAGQAAQRQGQIVLHGRPLAVVQVLIVGQDQGALLAIHHLLGAPAFGLLQTRLRGGLPASILVGNACQIRMLIQFDRPHIRQFQSVNQSEVVRGVIPFVENERRFSCGPGGTRPFFEPTLKLLQHHRKLLGIVAVAGINVVKKRQVFLGRAEQRIADLSEVAPALLVLAPSGHLALQVESVNEGVKVGAVITDLGQRDLLPLQDLRDELLPNGLGGLG